MIVEHLEHIFHSHGLMGTSLLRKSRGEERPMGGSLGAQRQGPVAVGGVPRMFAVDATCMHKHNGA